MVTARGLVLSIVFALAGCGGGGATLTNVPPPGSWRDALALERAARDQGFRNDADSPLPEAKRAGFTGLAYFDPDPSWRYAGYVERYPAPKPFTIVTTGGDERPCETWGRVTFEHDGRLLTLQVYRLLDQDARPGGEGLFLPFKDKTSGSQTYAAGRYVDLEGPDGGPYTLDFNRAYHPSCAYGDAQRFRCPVTPAENALDLRVAAGERLR